MLKWCMGVEVDVLIGVCRFVIDVKGESTIRFPLDVDVKHMDIAVDFLLCPCYIRMHVVDVCEEFVGVLLVDGYQHVVSLAQPEDGVTMREGG